METAGIICEYNPFHLGHAAHIDMTRKALGGDCGVVCVMSGNYVQRGEPAIFNKHARAEMAVRCGADLVVELPSPYALSSAEGFARSSVYILEMLGVCGHLSFGSESGDIGALREAAESIVTTEANEHIKLWLDKGLPYATAQQKAADAVMGEKSDIFKSPNNLLGIEYIKAISTFGFSMRPITVKRVGGDHDGDAGYSASAVRKMLSKGSDFRASTPCAVAKVCDDEISAGRGPVLLKQLELAILARLRAIDDFSELQGATEGLDRRFMRFVESEPTVAAIFEGVKTKRYAMSRLRRMLMCAVLGITANDTMLPPPYIRVLAFNRKGMVLLRAARKKSELPIITKPASVYKLSGRAVSLFCREVSATDFYVLAYRDEKNRSGGQEWRQSPLCLI